MKNKKILNFIMKALVFILTVSSLTQAIIISLELPIPYYTTILLTSIVYIVLSLYAHSIWSLVIGIPSTALIFILYSRRYLAHNWWEKVAHCAKWLIDYALGYESTVHNIYVLPATWLIIGGLSIIFFIVMCKLRLNIISIILGSSIIGILWYLGHTSITPYIWIYAVPFVATLGIEYRQKLNKIYDITGTETWQVWLVLLSLIIVLTSIIIVPKETEHLKWKALEETFESMEDIWESRKSSKKPRTIFRLTQTGFQGSSEQLGGPVEVDNNIALEIISPQTLYLKGSIFNEYTGNGWKNTIDSMAYKLNDPLNRKVKQQALDLDEKFWDELDILENQDIISRFTVDIEPVGINTSAIFAPSITTNVKSKDYPRFSPHINRQGELFSKTDISKNQGYILDVINLNLTNYDILNISEEFIPKIDFRKYIPRHIEHYDKLLEIQKNYSVIDNIPNRVKELAEDIIGEETNPMAKALALEQYLKENYVYTLSPPPTPTDSDFVDYFLYELKEGYCTYFATAMAVMGRVVGLPTRYVEGYSMHNASNHGTLYKVRNSNSHAWVEVYFPNIGWLTFDPTPPTYTDIVYGQKESPIYTHNLDNFMHKEMNIPEYHSNMDTDFYYEDSKINGSSTKLKLFVSFICIIAISISIFCLLLFVSNKIYERQIEKLPYSKQIELLYSKILALLELYNYPMKKGETPYMYANRVDTWLINKAGSMMDMTNILVKITFAGYPPTHYDVEKTENFCDFLERDTKKIIGTLRYDYIKFKSILRQLNNWIRFHQVS